MANGQTVISDKLKDAFKKAAGAKSTGNRNPNIRHGRYVFMMDKWFFRQGHKGISDVHELVVMKAEKIAVYHDQKEGTGEAIPAIKIEQEPNPVDSLCSAVFNYDGKAKDMAGINTTRFLLALLGIDDSEITEEDKQATLEDCTGLSNPTRGMLIACETAAVFTATTKRWIVVCNWANIDKMCEGSNTLEAAPARWAEYEARVRNKTQQAKQ